MYADQFVFYQGMTYMPLKGVQSHADCPPWAVQSQRLKLLGSIPGYGICSTDNSKIFARYWDKSAIVKKVFLL